MASYYNIMNNVTQAVQRTLFEPDWHEVMKVTKQTLITTQYINRTVVPR